MLNVHRLRLLRELQLRGTISAVAEVLSYSPSAVSQQLSLLEREAGIPLLEQVGRRLRLTRAGEILCDHTSVLLQQIEQAQADLARARKHLTGTLRAAAFQTATLRLIPTVLTLLREAHPELRVQISEIQPDNALSALRAYDFDLIVGEEYPGIPTPRTKDVHRQDLSEDPLLVVMPSSVGTEQTTLRDLADRYWVMEPVGNAARQWAESACRSAGFEPQVQFESSDLVAHMELVRTGHACALLPKLLCEHEGLEGVKLTSAPSSPSRTIFTAVRSGAEERPDLIAFRTTLETSLKVASSTPPPSVG